MYAEENKALKQMMESNFCTNESKVPESENNLDDFNHQDENDDVPFQVETETRTENSDSSMNTTVESVDNEDMSFLSPLKDTETDSNFSGLSPIPMSSSGGFDV
jgi:hypothetical protein